MPLEKTYKLSREASKVADPSRPDTTQNRLFGGTKKQDGGRSEQKRVHQGNTFSAAKGLQHNNDEKADLRWIYDKLGR